MTSTRSHFQIPGACRCVGVQRRLHGMGSAALRLLTCPHRALPGMQAPAGGTAALGGEEAHEEHEEHEESEVGSRGAPCQQLARIAPRVRGCPLIEPAGLNPLIACIPCRRSTSSTSWAWSWGTTTTRTRMRWRRSTQVWRIWARQPRDGHPPAAGLTSGVMHAAGCDCVWVLLATQYHSIYIVCQCRGFCQVNLCCIALLAY